MKIYKNSVLVIIQRIKHIFLLLSVVSLLCSCASIENFFGSSVGTFLKNEEQPELFTKGIPGLSHWIILPFRVDPKVNITDNMLIQFERTLKVQLPSYGIADSKLTDVRNRKLLQKYTNEQVYYRNSLDFAKIKKADFAISVKINQVKPTRFGSYQLGMNLTVYSIRDRTSVWYISGRRTGNNNEDLLLVYRRLIADLLKLAPIGAYKL